MPLSFPIYLPDLDATLAAGAALAGEMRKGGVIALVGELGSGKTSITQGVVSKLGGGEVTSPTFSLVQEYRGGSLEVYHFDFYRIGSEHELIALGWDDYLDRGGLVIVEWPCLFPNLLPKETRWLRLSHDPEGGASFRGDFLASLFGVSCCWSRFGHF